jgi:RNA polymerase sigma-70 factor (ECF subfamily)
MRDNCDHNVDPDGEALREARRGDLAAFESLAHRHQANLFSVAYRITGSYEDACEVVQDAFLAAFRGMKDFRGESRFSTWLTAITSNLSRNRLEQLRSRHRNEPVSLNDTLPGEDCDLSFDPPSLLPDPLEILERRSLQES